MTRGREGPLSAVSSEAGSGVGGRPLGEERPGEAAGRAGGLITGDRASCTGVSLTGGVGGGFGVEPGSSEVRVTCHPRAVSGTQHY